MINNIYGKIFSNSKKNAIKRGIPFELSEIEFFKIVKRSCGKCEVSGIEFYTDKKNRGWARQPFHPSIDRINSQHGYTYKNCRLVCTACNLAMNEWGVDILIFIALAINKTQIGINHVGAKPIKQLTFELQLKQKDALNLFLSEDLKEGIDYVRSICGCILITETGEKKIIDICNGD